jgi:hypothetical protein
MRDRYVWSVSSLRASARRVVSYQLRNFKWPEIFRFHTKFLTEACNIYMPKKSRPIIIWYLTPCNPVDYRWFGGTYCLHLQDGRVIQASNQQRQILGLERDVAETCMYRGISEFKKGYKPRRISVTTENGDLLSDYCAILNRTRTTFVSYWMLTILGSLGFVQMANYHSLIHLRL